MRACRKSCESLILLPQIFLENKIGSCEAFFSDCIGRKVINLLANLAIAGFGSRTVLKAVTGGSETTIPTYTTLRTAYDLTTGNRVPPGSSSH